MKLDVKTTCVTICPVCVDFVLFNVSAGVLQYFARETISYFNVQKLRYYKYKSCHKSSKRHVKQTIMHISRWCFVTADYMHRGVRPNRGIVPMWGCFGVNLIPIYASLKKNSVKVEWLRRRARHGFETITARVLALRLEPLNCWWGAYQCGKLNFYFDIIYKIKLEFALKFTMACSLKY